MAIQDDNTFLSKGDLKAYHEKILPYLGGNMMMSTNNSDYYSTDEKVVGVWTNGKPVYQKTFIINKANFTKVSEYKYEYSISSLNIDKLIKADSVASVNTDGQGVSPAITFTSNSINNSWNYGVLVTGSKIIMSLQADVVSYGGFSSVITTIQYTKTTDSANAALTTPGAYDINFPNTWPKNKEIYFGNGVYGRRCTGTITAAVDTRNITVFDSSNKTAKIINFGGYYTTVNAEYISLGAYPSGKNSLYKMSTIVSNSDSGLFLTSIDNVARSNSPYDVWVTYTK